jgi:aldose sugar dehydrogenase
MLLAAGAVAQSVPHPTPAKIYAANCASCHGTRLQGGQGASLIAVHYIHGTDDATIERSIKEGYPAKGMPLWSGTISEEDIRALVQFIKHERAENSPEHLAELDRALIRSLPREVIRTDVENFRIQKVAEPGRPWGMSFLPDGRLLVTEEQGGLRIIEKGRLLPPVEGIPEGHPKDIFHRTLLDVMAHPDFRANGWIYLTRGNSVERPGGQYLTEVELLRGRLKDGRWIDSQTLVRVPTDNTTTGRILLDGRGHVFLTTASEAGINEVHGREPEPQEELMRTAPQNLQDPTGKILRYNDDGSIPADNPFVSTAGAFGAVWSYGHRNSQGLALDSVTGQLWATEHGPRGGDELNLIQKGHNYGWPVISYGTRYDGIAFTTEVDAEGMDQPVINWTPSIAVSAIAFYEGRAFPRWNHALFVGSLIKQKLFRVVLSGNQAVLQELILKDLGRIRALAVGPDGDLYLALELKQQGLIVRLVPAH